jgi:hypothetical protein
MYGPSQTFQHRISANPTPYVAQIAWTVLPLCCSMVASDQDLDYVVPHGQNYLSAYTCFYDKFMGHRTW